jgi:hypothetical protein
MAFTRPTLVAWLMIVLSLGLLIVNTKAHSSTELNELTLKQLDTLFLKYSSPSNKSINSSTLDTFLDNFGDLFNKDLHIMNESKIKNKDTHHEEHNHDHDHKHESEHEHKHEDDKKVNQNCIKKKLKRLKAILFNSSQVDQIDYDKFKLITSIMVSYVDECYMSISQNKSDFSILNAAKFMIKEKSK